MKNWRKLIFPALLLIALVIVSSCGDKTDRTVRYIPVQFSEDGAWCFIDAEGRRVGNQEWDYQPTVTMGNIFTARTDSGLTVYRWRGDVAEPIDSLTNLVCVGVVNEGLLPVTPAMQRIRVVNPDGDVKFVLEPINGREIMSCSFKFSDGLLIVNNADGKAGAVDTKGRVVIEPAYDEISDFNDGYALAANYNFDDFDNGPSYFILDKEGNVKPVKGKFGYGEGDCFGVPELVNGYAIVEGPTDTVDYSIPMYKICVDGKVTLEDKPEYSQVLNNGDVITNYYTDEPTESVWKSRDGKVIMKTDAQLSFMDDYVSASTPDSLLIFNLEAQKVVSVGGNCSFLWAGGNFGPVVIDYGKDYTDFNFMLYNRQGQHLDLPKIYGVGTSEFIDLNEDEIMCRSLVTSAWVDVTAAAAKLAGMADGSVKGKEQYYLGQNVSDILEGENAGYYSGANRSFSIPGDSFGRLASGDGFWVDGSAKADREIVQNTYQQYFQVHHYDSWGNAWGHPSTRQVGVRFNPSAKIESFDIQLHTNHPSGDRLRQALSRRLKKDGFTQVATTPNYDQYANVSGQNVIVYGTPESKGVGMYVGTEKVASMRDTDKAALASTIY